jgi:magnesium-transporting ATPase (P-type)
VEIKCFTLRPRRDFYQFLIFSLWLSLHQVLRGGSVSEVSSAELVAGEVVLVESGDRVPGDAVLLEGNDY